MFNPISNEVVEETVENVENFGPRNNVCPGCC
jgi:DNA-directed RNA polymerase subunit E'/Rpb7